MLCDIHLAESFVPACFLAVIYFLSELSNTTKCLYSFSLVFCMPVGLLLSLCLCFSGDSAGLVYTDCLGVPVVSLPVSQQGHL